MKNKDGLTFKERLAIVKKSVLLMEKADKGCHLREVLVYSISTVKEYIAVYLAATVVDAVASGDKSFKELILIAGMASLATLAATIIASLVNRKRFSHEFMLVSNLRRFLWEKVMNIDYARVEDTRTHDKLRNANRQIWNYQTGLAAVKMRLTDTVTAVVTLGMGIGLITPIAFKEAVKKGGITGFIQSPWAFWLVIILVTVLELVKATVVNRKALEPLERVQNSREITLAHRVSNTYEWFVLDNYRNGKDIRMNDEGELILSEYKKNVRMIYDGWLKSYKETVPHNFMWQLLNIATRLLMYGFAVARAATGMLTPGEVIAFALYFTYIQNGISDISDSIGILEIAVPFCKQIFDFLDIPDEKYKGMIPTEKRDDNEYEFEFKHVYFKYPGSEEHVLRDINLKWKIGEKMALVGKNGCGKSTLVKLLCRLYDPTEGEITLNGVDIRKYKYEDYMELFSVVFQDSKLFSFSIAENVAAGVDYDAARVEDCVRRSGLSERLDEFENGIETILYKDFDERGIEISGGEAQKLILARAVYKGAPFIVLDEPTAALDPVSEYDIYTKFNDIVGTRTAIYISHRLSSCRFCDEITVMDGGSIAERGTHEELLLKNGVYKTLWTAQAEYYKDTAAELFQI